MSSFKVTISVSDLRNAINDAIMAILETREKMINEYVEEETQKREKWNNFKMMPAFLKKSLQRDVIIEDVKKLSFAKSLSCSVVWAPLAGEQTEKICNKYLSMLKYLSVDQITIEKKELDKIISWASKYKPVSFSF